MTSCLIRPLILIALSAALSNAAAAGLLGTRTPLTSSAFCRTYGCAAGPTQSAGGAFTRTDVSTTRAPKLTLVELRRAGTLISVRWSVGFQDNVIGPDVSAALQALSVSLTGQRVSASQLTRIDNQSFNGVVTASIPLGQATLSSVIQPYGDMQRLNVIFSAGKLSTLGIQEPPTTVMTAAQKQQALSAIAAAFTAQGSGQRRKDGTCGLTTYVALITDVPPATDPAWEEKLSSRVSRAARAAGFTGYTGWHKTYRGTFYTWDLGEDATYVCVRLEDQARP